MSAYLCLKALTLMGVDYIPGELVPGTAVLPGRERALIHQGYLAKAGEAGGGFELPAGSLLIQVGDLEEEKQAAIQQGNELAVSILSMNAAEAAATVKTVVQPFVLELVSLFETRKTVLDTVAAQKQALTEDSGATEEAGEA